MAPLLHPTAVVTNPSMITPVAVRRQAALIQLLFISFSQPFQKLLLVVAITSAGATRSIAPIETVLGDQRLRFSIWPNRGAYCERPSRFRHGELLGADHPVLVRSACCRQDP